MIQTTVCPKCSERFYYPHEGTHIRWDICPINDDERMAHVELLKRDFTKNDMLMLIEELMAVRERLKTSI